MTQAGTTGRRRTQSRFRLGGFGVQPLLLMFPLGLFWMAFVFDLATALGAPSLIGTVAFWTLVAGLGGGLLAAVAAGVEAFTAADPEAARIFFLGLLLDVGVLIVFAVLTLMRVRGHDRAVGGGLLALETAALALAGFSAWFSGRFADPRAPVSDPRPPKRRGSRTFGAGLAVDPDLGRNDADPGRDLAVDGHPGPDPEIDIDLGPPPGRRATPAATRPRAAAGHAERPQMPRPRHGSGEQAHPAPQTRTA